MTTRSLGRVLVIDDNRDLREQIGSALTYAGYEVKLAQDGDKAVEALRREVPDLTITDIFMPERDGIETINFVKRECPGTSIIAISGGARHARSAGVDYLAIARRFGADRVLHKPFEIDELLRVVEEVIKQRPK